MAEQKYDLLLGPKRDSNLKIRNQPWYRERVLTKYERKPNLDASSWTFIKGGLDDFRDGKPCTIDDSIVIKREKAVLPSIRGSNSFDRLNPKQDVKKHFKKHEAIYTKTIVNQGKRRKKVEDIEKNLLSHPLALYPHIGQSVPPEVFEDIIAILDPSMMLGFPSDESFQTLPMPKIGQTEIKQENNEVEIDEPIPGYQRAIRNIFETEAVGKDSSKPKTKCEEMASKDEKYSRTGRRKTLPSQLPHTSMSKIDYVTKEFCDWVRSLGGQTNNIEEETIKNLFASGCDMTTILTTPVHVVELTNVPPELRSKNDTANSINDVRSDDIPLQRTNEPIWSKMKYGAWYLDPKLWKARPAKEMLQDPRETKDKKMTQARLKSKELDTVLSSCHGTNAFRKFIDKKGVRKPVFFDSVPIVNEEGNPTRQRIIYGKNKLKIH